MSLSVSFRTVPRMRLVGVILVGFFHTFSFASWSVFMFKTKFRDSLRYDSNMMMTMPQMVSRVFPTA